MATLQNRVKGFPIGTFEWDGTREIRTYQDMWKVRADNENELPRTIVDTLNIPIGDPFPDDLFAYAQRVGPTRRSETNRLEWEVPVFYTTQFPLSDIDDLGKPPDERRLKRRWTFETMQEIFTHDAIATNFPVTNSVGEIIEATRDVPIPVLTVEKYELNFPQTTILNYANRTNESVFYGAPIATALMVGMEVEEDAAEVYEGVLYDRVRYTIKFKIPLTEQNKGWFMRLVDAGTQYIDPADPTKYLPYLSDADSDGNQSQITGPLDGFGNKLPRGDPLVFLTFNEHETAEFDDLSIGPND